VESQDIRFEPTPQPRAVEFLHARVTEFNLATTGLPPADTLLALERDDVGEIVAGIHGWVWGGTAEIDLLWFGGIGAYIKASTQSHADVGDKSNDILRVDAKDVRAKVIAEGANLESRRPAASSSRA